MAPARIAIVADDLTGALDSAAPFALRGLRVRVFLSLEALAAADEAPTEVLAVSTNSRELTRDAAVAATALAGALVKGAALVVKKVDSRLKGHVAAETAALLAALGRRAALIAPAIPEFGRIQSGGLLTGAGVAAPIDIAAAAGPGEIPDIREPADFAAALVRLSADPGLLPVGARGLTAAMAAALPGRAPPLPPPARPLLLAIGSVDPITRRQLARLRGRLGLPDLPKGGQQRAGDIVILSTPDHDGPPDPAAAARFASQANAAITDSGARAVLLSGGETAAHVLRGLGVDQVALLGEAQPGLPRMAARIGGRQVEVLTKSGGFGGPEALVGIVEMVDGTR